MNAAMPTRRTVLRAGLAAGGGFLLALRLGPPAAAAATAQPDGGFAPNAFIRIGRDGTVAFIMRNTEVGQGIYTAVAMLIAEELEVGARPGDDRAGAGRQRALRRPDAGPSRATGGSASIRGSWVQMREAGAVARTMLIAARRRRRGRWRPSRVRRKGGQVIELASGRTLAYGALADIAATPAGAARRGPEGPGAFHPGRHLAAPARHAVQGERDRGVRHRREGAPA